MINLRFILCCCFIIASVCVHAQRNLYFINRARHKVVEVQVGQQLSLKYKGYLNQPEFCRQTVTDITDSTITLGVDPALLGKGYQQMTANNPKFVYRKILIRDIIAFRRISVERALLKNALLVGNLIGSYYLLSDLYHNSHFSTPQTFLISFGTGILSVIVINLLLPENPKYQVENGWEVSTGFIKPKW
jgi:hypothetical protein